MIVSIDFPPQISETGPDISFFATPCCTVRAHYINLPSGSSVSYIPYVSCCLLLASKNGSFVNQYP